MKIQKLDKYFFRVLQRLQNEALQRGWKMITLEGEENSFKEEIKRNYYLLENTQVFYIDNNTFGFEWIHPTSEYKFEWLKETAECLVAQTINRINSTQTTFDENLESFEIRSKDILISSGGSHDSGCGFNININNLALSKQAAGQYCEDCGKNGNHICRDGTLLFVSKRGGFRQAGVYDG